MSWVCGDSHEVLEGRDKSFEEIAEHPLDERRRRRCVTSEGRTDPNMNKQRK